MGQKKKCLREVIIAEMVPKLLTDTKPQFSEAQRTPSQINTKNTPRCIIFTCRKPETEKILKETKEGRKPSQYRNKGKNTANFP